MSEVLGQDNAVESLVRFIRTKLDLDEMTAPIEDAAAGPRSEFERASAQRAVEAAAWAVPIVHETADILEESPVVRNELLKFLDLDLPIDIQRPRKADIIKTTIAFAASIIANPRLFQAVQQLSPHVATHIRHVVALQGLA